jgi:hypothetical protein
MSNTLNCEEHSKHVNNFKIPSTSSVLFSLPLSSPCSKFHVRKIAIKKKHVQDPKWHFFTRKTEGSCLISRRRPLMRSLACCVGYTETLSLTYTTW